ncbi:hypothetical protein LI328DRAFT_138765 [Trichoderma asperelloides]|nr:hypothetical protein LI328DRAFT_138765 [Trichoderma asperelloides]
MMNLEPRARKDGRSLYHTLSALARVWALLPCVYSIRMQSHSTTPTSYNSRAARTQGVSYSTALALARASLIEALRSATFLLYFVPGTKFTLILCTSTNRWLRP